MSKWRNFLAYHMNKTHWFSLHLNSTFSQQAYYLIDWSFDLTRELILIQFYKGTR